MILNKKMNSMVFKTVLLVSAVASFAATDTTLVQRLEHKLFALDSMNTSVNGFRVGGTATAGVLSSTLSSDDVDDDSPTRDNQAYTDVNLKLDARPGFETNVHLELRLHKDWQKGYDENVNPVIGHWFSYDGLILNKHVAFNLGYMRVGYTPLTLYTPQTTILQEPEIFTERRVAGLAQRNLDTTSNRLLQGLNVDYHSGSLSMLDDIYVQATGARLRNIAKKYDQLFFDFDWSDRYLIAGRLGATGLGADLGANATYTFDRIRSTRAYASAAEDKAYYYEDNFVFSVNGAYDSKGKITAPVTFGLNAEYAMSNWKYQRDTLVTTYEKNYYLEQGVNHAVSPYDTTYYVTVSETATTDYDLSTVEELDGSAFYVEPFVQGNFGKIGLTVKGMYLQNGEDFWSEQASSPNYKSNTSILNADAFYSDSVGESLLSELRSGNLENLYFSVYNTNVLNQTNIMSTGGQSSLSSTRESSYMMSRLYNNYKLGHFYRNGYDAEVWQYMDASTEADLLDPSVNMALPFGLATPDRKGFSLSLDGNFAESFELNVRFSQIERQSFDIKYTTMALGLGFNLGRFFDLSRTLTLQGSVESAEETTTKLTTTRIVAGLNVGIYGPVSFLAGLQTLNKDYGDDPLLFGSTSDDGTFSATAAVSSIDEFLVLAGPRIKISPLSFVSIQGGWLTNSINYINYSNATKQEELSIDKLLVVVNLMVNF